MPPTRSIRPRIDSARPWRVGGATRDRSRSHDRGRRPRSLVARIEEDRDLVDAGVAGRVRHRLTGGQHECLDSCSSSGASPVRTTSTARRGAPRPRRRPRRARRRGALRRGRAVGIEPRAQLAFLPAREGGDAARVAGLPLDKFERLQHGVVHACRHLGSLLVADPRGPLGVALRREPPRPGADQSRSATATALGRRKLTAGSVAFWSTKTKTPTTISERPRDERRTSPAAREDDPGARQRRHPDERIREAEVRGARIAPATASATSPAAVSGEG